MKIKIEIDDTINEEEIIIRCSSFTNNVKKIQDYLENINNSNKDLIFYKDNSEFYIKIEDILFFETDNGTVNAHTLKDIFYVKYKLYELENILPGYFIRVSKSTILNMNHIYSLTKNISSVSIVEFKDTYKKVYVSRNYYKLLKQRLEEKRFNL